MTGSPGGRDGEGLRQTCQDAGRGWPGPAFASASRTGRWLVVPPQLGATFQGLSRIGANAKPTIARLRHRRRSVRCTPDAGMDDAVPVPPPMEAGRKEKKGPFMDRFIIANSTTLLRGAKRGAGAASTAPA